MNGAASLFAGLLEVLERVGGAPKGMEAVSVHLDEALEVALRTVGAAVAGRIPPDLLVDAVLKSVEGRPCWEVSYDVWLESAPESFHRVRVDAVTGEVAAVLPGGG